MTEEVLTDLLHDFLRKIGQDLSQSLHIRKVFTFGSKKDGILDKYR